MKNKLICELCGKTETVQDYAKSGWVGCQSEKKIGGMIDLDIDVCPTCNTKKGFNMTQVLQAHLNKAVDKHNADIMKKGVTPADILNDTFIHEECDLEFRGEE